MFRKNRTVPILLATAVGLATATCGPALAGERLNNLAQPSSNRVEAQGVVSMVARRVEPGRLVQSSGNLYWTENIEAEFSPSSSTVYRTSKAGNPGSERVIYREDGVHNFGALTYANVGGIWYGFVATDTYPASRKSSIKRFRLDGSGGVTTIIANSTYISDLTTDGTSLFWTDTAAVKSTPLEGGVIGPGIRIVKTIALTPGIERIGLAGSRIFFATRTFIRSVPKNGGGLLPVYISPRPITSFAVGVRNGIPTVFWGDNRARVASKDITGKLTQYQAPHDSRYFPPDRTTTSVAWDGIRVLWSDCTLDLTACALRSQVNGVAQPVIDTHGLLRSIVGDNARTFWIRDSRIMRYAR